MCWPIGISLVSFPAATNSQVEIDAQLAEASPQWGFWTCGEHGADYWAVVISQLQTHPSNFVCGIGTESLKTTFLLCQLFPHSFCQYGVLEWGCRAGGGIPDMPACLPPFLKVSPQQWLFTQEECLFSAVESGFWLSPSMPAQGHHSQLGTVPLLSGQGPALWGSNLYSLFPYPSQVSVTSQSCLCSF